MPEFIIFFMFPPRSFFCGAQVTLREPRNLKVKEEEAKHVSSEDAEVSSSIGSKGAGMES